MTIRSTEYGVGEDNHDSRLRSLRWVDGLVHACDPDQARIIGNTRVRRPEACYVTNTEGHYYCDKLLMGLRLFALSCPSPRAKGSTNGRTVVVYTIWSFFPQQCEKSPHHNGMISRLRWACCSAAALQTGVMDKGAGSCTLHHGSHTQKQPSPASESDMSDIGDGWPKRGIRPGRCK
ncbi:hypothetical protein LIA77_02201 [Sarocladium implicatum]|nr:hypothetical protein LIA77_02201 [Sarocladium implicatum]